MVVHKLIACILEGTGLMCRHFSPERVVYGCSKFFRYVFTVVLLASVTHLPAQTFQFTEPERLPISLTGEEIMPLLFPDGSRIFFGRMLYPFNTGGELDGSDVWVSEKVTEKWKRAGNLEFTWNNGESHVVVGINERGTGIYVLSNNKKSPGVYYSERENIGWSVPVLIPVGGLAQSGYLGFYVVPSEDVMLISMKGENSMGEEDIYVSVKDTQGRWSPPKNLGPTINTTGYEISPFLTPDKKRLFFASNGHPGRGDADLFYSERLYESWETWSVPKNLGDKINSNSFDAYLSIYGDSVVYFVSNRSGNLSDVYQSQVKVVNTSMAEGSRKYLEPEEIARVIGAGTLRVFTFDENVSELSVAQRELLWYIGGKVIERKEISIYLRAIKKDEASPKEIHERRLSGMIEYLRLAGVDPLRIKFGVEAAGKPEQLVNKNAIELLLFR